MMNFGIIGSTFLFCKRQWALIHVERQWEDNQRTVEGQYIHERADDPLSRDKGEIIISVHIPDFISTWFYGTLMIEYVRASEGIVYLEEMVTGRCIG